MKKIILLIRLIARNSTSEEIEKHRAYFFEYTGKYKQKAIQMIRERQQDEFAVFLEDKAILDDKPVFGRMYVKRYFVNSEKMVVVATIKRIKSYKQIYTESVIASILTFSVVLLALIPLILRIFSLRREKDRDLLNHLYTDDLTKLGNRTKLLKDLHNIPEDFYKNNKTVTLIISDIQNFKNINSHFGFVFGNRVLEHIAEEFEKYFKDKYGFEVYRISGDKFAFFKVSEKINGEETLIKKVITNFNSLDYHDEQTNIEISLELTFGISFTEENILTNAELSLTEAKKLHRPFYISTVDSMIDITQKIKLNTLIHNAISSDKIILFYQPIVGQNGEIVKYESLLRIDDGEKILTPCHFLDYLKQTNYYSKVSQIVIQKAIQSIKKTKKSISINLSYEDLINEEIVRFLSKSLFNCNCGNLLTIEIVESDSIESFEKVKSFIEKVRKFGVEIAIDDFGSGYSNYQNIIELKPDYLKIDGSLIKDINKDSYKYSIVKSIINFATELNIKVICEFVENEEVFELLKQHFVYGYQGWYFYKPQPDIF